MYFLQIFCPYNTINIIFYKTKILSDILIENYKPVMYINPKILFKFHTIWLEMKGHIDLGPNSKRLFILIIYQFPAIYIYFN